MQFYSTKNKDLRVDFREAVFKGLPDDNGLFMPVKISKLPEFFIKNLNQYSFQEVSFQVASTFLQGAIPEKDLKNIIENAVNFSTPVVQLDPDTFVLELFHGPSLAFKDFGARFMAATMSYFLQENQTDLTILVATSGDTGGAVAAGFFDTPGINVVILYPSGKVSDLQEKQLTTFGKNIAAIEVDGTFDDCQAMVKQAFLDSDLKQEINLSSANSINIARLLPQMFYYFEGFKQVSHLSEKVVFVVPSGNFGNLTAGLFAKKMGLPVHRFVAATNMNSIVSDYLQFETYQPLPSIQTLSNAMDVGNPSNFARITDLYRSTWNDIKNDIFGTYISDNHTSNIINKIFSQTGYYLDPHAAVGFGAWKNYWKKNQDSIGVILETAHPVKFIQDPSSEGNGNFISEKLSMLRMKEKNATRMSSNFSDLKNWLLQH